MAMATTQISIIQNCAGDFPHSYLWCATSENLNDWGSEWNEMEGWLQFGMTLWMIALCDCISFKRVCHWWLGYISIEWNGGYFFHRDSFVLVYQFKDYFRLLFQCLPLESTGNGKVLIKFDPFLWCQLHGQSNGCSLLFYKYRNGNKTLGDSCFLYICITSNPNKNIPIIIIIVCYLIDGVVNSVK